MTTKQEIAMRNKLHLVCDEVGPLPENLERYELALSAAGVKVLNFKEFGDWQGRWWARVQFPNGEIYFVTDYYGSCSGCDAFLDLVGYDFDEESPSYAHKLKDFGRGYLENCMTLPEAIEEASENIDWDYDAEEMVSWLNQFEDTPRKLFVERDAR